MSYLMSTDWLKKRLENDWENTVIVDVRFQLNDPDAGRKAYLDGHIPEAYYLNLNHDLSAPVQKHGGNHPLPDMKLFARKMGHIGITHDTVVVVYDQANDMFAARMWWMLHYLGHEKVYLLDGGYERWVGDGNDISTMIPTMRSRNFEARIRADEVVTMDQVKEKMKNKSAVLIDSRAKDRYLGKVEPMYGKAGHIPGAKNYFWQHVLRKNGSWKNADELQEHFGAISMDDEIIVSCGSGVSACPNILALKMAGFKKVKLYPGSYSDWISYAENEVQTRAE